MKRVLFRGLIVTMSLLTGLLFNVGTSTAIAAPAGPADVSPLGCTSTAWGQICAWPTGAPWTGIDLVWDGNGSSVFVRLGWNDNRGVLARGGWVEGSSHRSHWWDYPWTPGDCVTGQVDISGIGTFTVPPICA